MQYYKIIFSILATSLLSVLNADAQINPVVKPTKTWESNGLSSTPAPKSNSINLGQDQKLETVAKMEKQEKETNELAIAGDGRVSKTEDAILNQMRTLKNAIK